MRTAEEIEKQILGLQNMKNTLPKINFLEMIIGKKLMHKYQF